MPAHKSKLMTSDAILYMYMSLGIVSEYMMPSSIELSTLVRWVIGIPIVVTGWAVIITAKRQFAAHCQSSGPGHETTELLTTGIFSISRNPIYLGVSILPVGFGFIFNSWWVIGSSAPTAYLIHYLLILSEERYLLDTFGKQYVKYCTQVRRWI